MLKAFFTLIVCVYLGACATTKSAFVTRASNDLKCPEDKILLTKLDKSTRVAKGCKKEATYRANCVNDGIFTFDCDWNLDGVKHETAPVEAEPEVTPEDL